MLTLVGRVRTLCNLQPSVLTTCQIKWLFRFGARSWRGICHIWFRRRYISPSMPYREASSVAESIKGTTAFKSNRTGRACLVFWRQWWEMVSCRLGRLKCTVVNIAVDQWSCLSGLSVHELQDLPIQFGQVLKAKSFNRCCTLLVGLGAPRLIKKSMKWQLGVFPCHGKAELPTIR